MGDRKMKFEPLSGNDFVHVAPPYCYRCPFGLEPTELRAGLRQEHGDHHPGRGARDGGRGHHRAGHERGRRGGAARRLPARGGRPLQAVRHPPARRRGHQRLRPHRAGSSPTSTAGVKPDIVTVAKGISSAYLPMAATVVRNTVFQSFLGDPSENRQVNQVNTYGGHPVAAAVALRNIEILLEEKLAERSAENGAYLLDGLRTLTRHPWVGDVRGKGLYAGVELVTDRATKAVDARGPDQADRRALPGARRDRRPLGRRPRTSATPSCWRRRWSSPAPRSTASSRCWTRPSPRSARRPPHSRRALAARRGRAGGDAPPPGRLLP